MAEKKKKPAASKKPAAKKPVKKVRPKKKAVAKKKEDEFDIESLPEADDNILASPSQQAAAAPEPPPPVIPTEELEKIDLDTVSENPEVDIPIRSSEAFDLPIDHDEEEDLPIGLTPSAKHEQIERPSAVEKLKKLKAKKPRVHLSVYRKLATTFVGLAVLLLAFVLYLAFAKAEIVVKRHALPVNVEFSLSVLPEPEEENAVPGAVLETVVEGRTTVQVEGETTSVEGTACGTVTIVNNQDRMQPLVATTRLLSPDEVLFRIQENIEIAAGERVDVKACADKPGAAGDVDPTRFTIPGLNASLQELTYAISTESFTGGMTEVAIVTQEQVDGAIDDYAKEVADEAAKQLAELLSRPEVGSGSFVSHDIVRRETTANIGEIQDQFDITLSVHVLAVFYDQDAVNQFAEANLRNEVSQNQELLRFDSNQTEVTLNDSDAVSRKAQIQVKAQGAAVITANHPDLDREKITGMSVDDLNDYFRSIDTVGSVDVKLRPGWTKRLPQLADHIYMTLE